MASSKPFYTDNMTVEEILNLGDDVTNSWKERDFSRALRTVSLAANKRVNRLLKYSKKRGGKYVEKINGPGLDLSALNQIKGQKFGVGNKTLNQMRAEFAKVRSFMQSVASTIKGAIGLRKKKEIALFGQTREELTKGMSKREAKEKIKEITELGPDVYEAYEDFKGDYAMQGGYSKEEGAKVLQDIGRDMLEGLPAEAAKANAEINADNRYEEGQTADNDDFWQDIEGPREWWEDV